MEKHTTSQQMLSTNVNNEQFLNNDETSSSMLLQIDPNEPLINDTGRRLFQAAVKRARDEKNKTKTRPKNQRPTVMKNKKSLKTEDVDQLFEEKRVRTASIEDDLLNLYETCSPRIRLLLDKKQIDYFIQTTMIRKNIENIKSISEEQS